VSGFAWSFFPSNYRVSIDDAAQGAFSSNSSLANSTNGFIFTSGTAFVQANLSSTSHVLTVDNDKGAGIMGLDYVEVISVSGGSP
jgi:hypothetical protein